MEPEEYGERQEEMLGWPIKIVTYRLGDTFFCAVYNVEPECRLSRGKGATRGEAEAGALEQARWCVQRSGYRKRNA